MKATAGALALGSVTVTLRVLNMLAWIVLARLLDPQDFGLVALAMIVFSATDIFAGLGMEPAIIHSKKEPGKIAFPAFVATSAASTVLFLLIFLGPALWSSILGTNALIPLIRVLSLLVLLDALAIVPRALLKKELLFGRVSSAKFVAEIVNISASLLLVYLGFGLWSLIYGKLLSSFVRFIILWVSYPGWAWLRPIPLRWSEMRDLLSFGFRYMGSGLLSFFNSKWDDWLVGRVLGPAALGFYSKAYNFTNQIIVGFNREVIGGVLFPSYATIQDEKQRLSRIYLKSLGVVALIMTPLSMGVLVIASELVPLLLGVKWLPMAATLQIFALMALIRPLSGSTSPLFKAIGRPEYNFRAGLVLTAVTAPLIFLLLDFGINGVAVAVTTAHVVGMLFNMYQLNKLLPGIALKMVSEVVPILFAGSMMMIAVQISKSPLIQFAGGEADAFALVGMILVGGIIYGVVAFLMRRELILETFQLTLAVLRPKSRWAIGGELDG